MDENIWLYNGKPFDEPEGYFGFVYVITNKLTGKAYIGKKQFFSTVTRPPLKGYKRKRKITKDSDWRTYWGSSQFFKEDVDQYGKSNYTREILTLCVSKSHLTYEETRRLFVHNVLYERLDNGEKKYFNGNISGKFHWRQEIEDSLLLG